MENSLMSHLLRAFVTLHSIMQAKATKKIVYWRQEVSRWEFSFEHVNSINLP